jgi:hypothetical protein
VSSERLPYSGFERSLETSHVKVSEVSILCVIA